MNKHHYLLKALSVLSFSLAMNAYAQESLLPCDELEKAALEEASPEEIKRISSYRPASVLRRTNPRYPESAAMRSQEGWVQMSYVIDEEGNVQDPVVEDYAGSPSFKRSALRAIKTWKYEPAMKDGKPTQQCDHTIQFEFTMAGQTGASKSFIRKYKDAIEYLDNGELDKAEKIIQALHEEDDLNRYENAWLWSADSQIAAKLGDDRRELASLRRTIRSSNSHSKKNAAFNHEYIAYMQQRVFELQAVAGLYGDALQTIEQIKESENAEATLAPLQESIEQVKAFIASENHIFVDAELGEDNTHFHTLARNQFAFVNIQGQLDTVEVRCETHREVFTVAEDFVWNIPQSWGQCRVLVKGKEGTQFNLVEVASV